MNFIRDMLLGSPERQVQLKRFTPQQQAWQSQAGQMAMQGLQNPLAGFEPITQQARQQFQTQTIPSLAERFTSMGQGAQRSSGFTGALGSAGQDLESSLAALASQYGQRQQGISQNLLGLGMQPSFEPYLSPRQPGVLQQGMQQMLPMLLQLMMGGI